MRILNPLISIVILTLYRPKSLHNALVSAAHQIAPGYDIEIIVADNSPDASARVQVTTFASQTSLTIKYISAPQPGIANVRNAALSMVEGRFSHEISA